MAWAKKQGLQEGIEKGIEKGQRKIALTMLQDGVDIHKVAEYTELTLEEIGKFKK